MLAAVEGAVHSEARPERYGASDETPHYEDDARLKAWITVPFPDELIYPA